ncbi:MAG TPA: DUF4233 domain-containing protein [Nocardioidaceae bacterium]|nr:DUF4233 domain-containing protein [Nocardioidaceae bacterium]
MRTMCASVLGLQSVILFLTTPVLITVADVDVTWALVAGLGLGVLAIVAAASLRSPYGYWLGHLVQVGAVAMGLLLPVMFFLGAVFAGLWVLALVLGRRVEEAKAARSGAT